MDLHLEEDVFRRPPLRTRKFAFSEEKGAGLCEERWRLFVTLCVGIE